MDDTPREIGISAPQTSTFQTSAPKAAGRGASALGAHLGPLASPGAAPNLADAMRRARTQAAERSEVIAELRGAEQARLEMLAEAIRPVLAQVPDSIDFFDAGLVPGDRPRYFVDMLAFVEMGRDRRTYHFVQDTRHGRIVLAESDRIDTITEAVTAYVARRLVEREQALASDQTIEKAARAYAKDAGAAKPLPVHAPAAQPRRRFFFTALMFTVELLGSIVLFGVLAALAYFGWQAGWHWWSLQQGG